MKKRNSDIKEEELKNKVGKDWFDDYDWTGIVGNIDFSVAVPPEKSGQMPLFGEKEEYILWAEAKKGNKNVINESFVQLILTIGKARTFERYSPPKFLGAFDAERISFIEYSDVVDIFYEGDFNWKVKPSDHSTKEFKQLSNLVEEILNEHKQTYIFTEDDKALRKFIKDNFKVGKKDVSKIPITDRNFMWIYQRWIHEVMPSINIDWDVAQKQNILPVDFYLADLLSNEGNKSLCENLFVLLRNTQYDFDVQSTDIGFTVAATAKFNDDQSAHKQFWNKYKRPPEQTFWDKIIGRRDLLVPQDVRKRKGAFFTPALWVRLSQKYLEKEFGENWQEEYYVWDCCAGTGNLLEGLLNKNNLFASTLDVQDVKVMRQRIVAGKLNLWENQVFQFDFLNDEFAKLPQSLQDIVEDPDKRRKLIMYINPPYAEATSATTATGSGTNKGGVARNNMIFNKYGKDIGKANNELFAQFLIRMYNEVEGCIIANFSTLKSLLGSNFETFRKVFRAKLSTLFIVPANTFDNVTGEFPIGFHIWHTAEKIAFELKKAEVYDRKGNFIGNRMVYNPDSTPKINSWIEKNKGVKKDNFGTLFYRGNDFQNQQYIYIGLGESEAHDSRFYFNNENIIIGCVYLAVRQCMPDTWLNDRDQFFAPKNTWERDIEFQNDCLVYTLFHRQNKITSKKGQNGWIPFTEKELGLTKRFDSHFVIDFIKERKDNCETNIFSKEAQIVMNAGRELWRYYYEKRGENLNASYYDIRMEFKGIGSKGRMNKHSDDEQFNNLYAILNNRLEILAKKLAPKVYEHGFLMR